MQNDSIKKSGSMQQMIEKVKYKGVLRLLGSIVNCNDKVVGYVVMIEETKKMKPYTYEQVVLLMKKFSFVNAKLEGNTIECIECSINRLLKFNERLIVIGNKGVTILGEIYENNRFTKYRVIDEQGRIVDLSESELITLAKTGVSLINSKIVGHDNKYSVSAIKGEFTRIDIVKQCITYEKTDTKGERNEYIKERYRIKVARELVINMLYYIEAYSAGKFEISNYGIRHGKLPLNKVIKILLKEVVPTLELSSGDKDKLSECISKYILGGKTLNHSILVYTKKEDYLQNNDNYGYMTARYVNDKVMHDCNIAVISLAQFLINDGTYKYLKSRLAKYVDYMTQKDKIITELIEKGLVSEKLLKLINDAKAIADSIEIKKKRIPKKPFEQTEFSTNASINQLGFTLSKEAQGRHIVTDTNSKLTLKYIPDYINDYAKYEDMIEVFGDVGVLAQIKRTMEVDYFDDKEKLDRCEIMLAIMSLYRPDIVRSFLDSNPELTENRNMLPNINTSIITDYNISEDLKLYYDSAFNVYKKTVTYIHNKDLEANIKNNKLNPMSGYTNYRSSGNRKQIAHPDLYEQLAPVVSLITSDECDLDTIYEYIGKLRVL